MDIVPDPDGIVQHGDWKDIAGTHRKGQLIECDISIWSLDPNFYKNLLKNSWRIKITMIYLNPLRDEADFFSGIHWIECKIKSEKIKKVLDIQMRMR